MEYLDNHKSELLENEYLDLCNSMKKLYEFEKKDIESASEESESEESDGEESVDEGIISGEHNEMINTEIIEYDFFIKVIEILKPFRKLLIENDYLIIKQITDCRNTVLSSNDNYYYNYQTMTECNEQLMIYIGSLYRISNDLLDSITTNEDWVKMNPFLDRDNSNYQYIKNALQRIGYGIQENYRNQIQILFTDEYYRIVAKSKKIMTILIQCSIKHKQWLRKYL